MNNKIQNLPRIIHKNLRGLILGISGAIILTAGIFALPVNVQAVENSAPSIYTSYSADITQTSVTLRGSTDPNGASTTAWFEWGTSSSGLTNETSHQNMGDGTLYIDFLSGLTNLSNNTTYYYRTVAHNTYGTSYGSTRSFTTKTLPSSGNPPSVYTGSATDITQTFVTLRGSVNPNSSATSVWFKWGPSADGLTHETNHQDVGNGASYIDFLTGLTDLSPNTIYYYKAVAENEHGLVQGSTKSFNTKQEQEIILNLPSVYTSYAFDITQNSTTIRGTVNPKGFTAASWFEWGAAADGLTHETSHQDAGKGTISIDYLVGLTGLSSNITYYYRAVSQNENGISRGSTRSFTTKTEGTTDGGGGGGGGSCLPIITTKPASFITKDSASLRALINPQGRSTSGWFEYGKSYALTLRTTTTHVGSGSVDTDLLRYLPNLDSNTTYYFRAIAENNCGKAQGSILSFTTEIGVQPPVIPSPSPSPSPTPTPLTPTPPIIKDFSLTKEIKNLTFPNGTVHINASFIGDTLEYYLNIKNNQSTALNDILVKDIIDGHFEFIEADLKIDSSSSGNTLYWKIDSIKPEETKIITYRIKTKIVEESTIIPKVLKAEVNGVSIISNEATTILNPTLMSLDISADKNHVNRNEEFTYTIRYRNIGIADVDNTLLKVSLPAYINFKDADKNYTDEGNVLFFNLRRVNKNEAGTIHINVQVNKDAPAAESLVATAVLDFTDVFNDPQPNISVSAVVMVESGFFGLSSAVGVFGKMDFWLWLILLLIAGFVFGIFYTRYKITQIMKA
ncbi:fibronectin type III domain-containing protein [Patescibacteria group bacterium]|nr:fibronectin type III domain-containing protein [Patescibacteria group bacterium]